MILTFRRQRESKKRLMQHMVLTVAKINSKKGKYCFWLFKQKFWAVHGSRVQAWENKLRTSGWHVDINSISQTKLERKLMAFKAQNYSFQLAVSHEYCISKVHHHTPNTYTQSTKEESQRVSQQHLTLLRIPISKTTRYAKPVTPLPTRNNQNDKPEQQKTDSQNHSRFVI